MAITTIFILIETLFTLKKIQLHKSNFFGFISMSFILITILIHIYIYTYLSEMFLSLYSTELLSRVQLLFMLIPLILATTLLNQIAKTSERNFKLDYSKGKVLNYVDLFLRTATFTLLIMHVILLIFPDFMEKIIVFHRYTLSYIF